MNPAKAEWIVYGSEVTITSYPPATDDALELGQSIVDMMYADTQRAVKSMVEFHRMHFDGELPPMPKRSRFRKWLGWKLWGLAARINPDVTW